jgi:hypothetical protein
MPAMEINVMVPDPLGSKAVVICDLTQLATYYFGTENPTLTDAVTEAGFDEWLPTDKNIERLRQLNATGDAGKYWNTWQ